jgi:4-amino-4-deoxy-L-arabinose transferase-like glycosyltransferase
MLKQRYSLFAVSLVVVWLAFWLRFDQLETVPFSWHLDEAAHGLEARDILRGIRPIFFPQFTGHEAMFAYAIAGAFTLFGDSIWSARLVSATAGVLTVALTIPLGATLWPGARGRRIGQWAAALLSISLWHLVYSRSTYRVILQPLMQLPALIFLLKAIRHSSEKSPRVWVWWALAGLFTGLNFHTYLAARVFPLALALIGGAAIALGPERWRPVKGLILAGLVAALIALPLVWYFYNHPFDLYGRAADISFVTPDSTVSDVADQVWRNVRDTAGMFTVKGDYSHKRNIRDEPVFDLFTGAAFFIGLAAAVIGLARRRHVLVSVTLLSWLIVMVLPGVLSVAGVPNYSRLFGALPVVMIFPALIFEWGWSWAARLVAARFPSPHVLAAANVALLAPFVGLTLAAYPHYFVDWNNVDSEIERVVPVAYFMRDVQPTWQGEPVYLSSSYPEQITQAYLDPFMYAATRGFDNRQAVPFPPEGRPTDYYVLLEDQPNRALLQKAGLQYLRTVNGRFGQPVYEVYHWDGRWPTPSRTQPMGWGWETQFPPGWQPNPIPAPVNFQNNLSLLGYDLSADTGVGGDPLTVTLYWRLNGPADGQYMFFVHVLDPDSQVVTQHDDNRYPSLRWHAGEMLLSEFSMMVPPGTPSGAYQIEIGVYHLYTGERMWIVVDGENVANRLFLQPITVR